MRTFFLAALLAACTAPADEADDAEAASGRVIEEGTPEAMGVLAFLNDAGTSQTLLDIDVGLDKRAAQGLVAHRAGKDGKTGTADDDLFTTIAEVDAVKYVGDAALADLLSYAREHDWVPAGDDFYGSLEGVDFTVAEAAGTIVLCNTAELTVLDVDVGLDSRAAKNLVALRPFATLEDIAAVSYVGKVALTHLRDYAKAQSGTTLSTPDAVTALDAAVPGLLYTSESDYPLVVFTIEGAGTSTITISNAKTVLASAYVQREGEPTLAERGVEQKTIAEVFDRYTVPQDWWEDWNYTDQVKWQAVRSIFDNGLEDATVFRFGEQRSTYLSGAIDVFVIGVTADGDVVGVRTVSVET